MAIKKRFLEAENPVTVEPVHNKFISTPKADQTPEEETVVKKETKSKRLQLLIYPSVYEACKRKADSTGESVNEIINEILKNHFTKE